MINLDSDRDKAVPDVPLKLLLFRIIDNHDGPISISEIRHELLAMGCTATRRTIVCRLSDLVQGYYPALQVQRVMKGVYQRIPNW